MAYGLEKVLEDQRSNLNPEDVSLHKKLADTISRVNMLRACVKEVLGGECSPKPPPPKLPTHTFERKQWSHTLLKTAKNYLDWMEHKVGVHILKIKGKNEINTTLQKYMRGSGHLL